MNPLSYIKWAAIGGVAVAIGLLFWQWRDAEKELIKVRAEYADFVTRTEVIGQAAEQERVQLVRDREIKVKGAEVAGAKRIETLTRLNTDLERSRRELLNTIAAGSGSSEASPDTAAACHGRAKTYGLLLGTADERAERDARELEALNNDKRICLEAWPTSNAIF